VDDWVLATDCGRWNKREVYGRGRTL